MKDKPCARARIVVVACGVFVNTDNKANNKKAHRTATATICAPWWAAPDQATSLARRTIV